MKAKRIIKKKPTTRVNGGMMNVSFKYPISKKRNGIVYFPTPNANKDVDRKIEKQAQKWFFMLGITSKNLSFNTRTGIKKNVFIEGKDLTKEENIDLKKVSKLFHKLHDCKLLVGKKYDLFPRLEGLEDKVSKLITLDKSYFVLKETLLSNKEYLESQKMYLTHGDAQKSNIIHGDDDNYYFIDFEFSMDNDPLYDIACYANGNLKDGEDLLEEYMNHNVSVDHYKRFYLYRIYLSVQWYLFAMNKHANKEDEVYGFDFVEVGKNFLDIAKKCVTKLKKLEK